MPVDPAGEWRTPPFDPVIRGGYLYGRGACDDKGQLFTHVKALESYLKSDRVLPVNVKCLFEGEEEAGSAHLASFISRNKAALRADAAVMSDTRMLAQDRPTIGYSQRGALMLELEVHGPAQDLHSGNFGGAVQNPLQALCEMVASLHDEEGRIAIPGFYDKVRNWSGRERDFMTRTGPPDDQILKDAQVRKSWGERGFSLYERTTIRPSLSVHGIVGGHQAAGIKTVIPARALAKLSFRLVPDQDPDDVARSFREHIAQVTPPSVRSTVRVLSSSKPALVKRNHPALRAAAFAYRKGFGAPAVFQRSGGTIPVINTFQELLGIPTVLMGFGLPDNRIHAPNEKFHLPSFHKGIATSIWFLAAAGAMLRQKRETKEVAWSAADGD
jgi:acetylornithine deacetylase/succinyl-diaminopimelate desuccinylase-like protein